MSLMKKIRVASFLILTGLFVTTGGQDPRAAYFDCFGSVLAFIYYGSEVECNGGWGDAMCEAGCDYCFHTGCTGWGACEPGQSIGGACNNSY